jgi:c-di-AMP phosphodiesterase-like protein
MCGANTLLVVVDVHRAGIYSAKAACRKAEKIAIIDHHRRGSEFIENAVITYIEPMHLLQRACNECAAIHV